MRQINLGQGDFGTLPEPPIVADDHDSSLPLQVLTKLWKQQG
jgi:hypothetical protein